MVREGDFAKCECVICKKTPAGFQHIRAHELRQHRKKAKAEEQKQHTENVKDDYGSVLSDGNVQGNSVSMAKNVQYTSQSVGGTSAHQESREDRPSEDRHWGTQSVDGNSRGNRPQVSGTQGEFPRPNEGSSLGEESDRLEEVSRLMFGLTVNDELSSSSNPDPLWHTQHPNSGIASIPGKSPVDTEEVMDVLTNILESSSEIKASHRGANLPKQPLLKSIIRPIKSAIERRREKITEHISTTKAMNTLQSARQLLSSVKAELSGPRFPDVLVLDDLKATLAAARGEVESVNRNDPQVISLREEVSAEIDALESRFNELSKSVLSNPDNRIPVTFRTGE